MDEEARVDVEIVDGIARMVLVNPARRNAITLAMADQIAQFCDRVQQDESIGAVVVDSVGQYFCSGADTRELAASSVDPASPESVARISAVYGAFVRVGELPVPTVALVRGGAVGAGMNLVLAADVVLVTADAVLDSGFLARGIHPGGGHLRLLGRSVGYQRAVAMGVLGAPVTGLEAVNLGLAWRAVPESHLLDEARRLVALAAVDPELTRRIKRSAKLELEAPGLTWPAAIEVERGMQMWSLARKGSSGWSRQSESR